jgi:2-octaprenyl-6-methoxyphenol hydroxylase
MIDASYDVVIAGGGPVGALLALALGESPLAVLHVDSAEPGVERPIALSHGSRLLLERCGVFQRIPSTPIATIHVSQRSGFGRALLRAGDYALPALGYVADYTAIRAAMASEMKGSPRTGRITASAAAPGGLSVSLTLPDGGERSVRTRLLVRADGSAAAATRVGSTKDDAASAGTSRVRDYAQNAVVTQVQAQILHRNIAYERFTPEGPLALLPNNTGYALVWCTHRDSAADLLNMGEQDFLARLGAAFGTRLGKFVACGERHAFPLALRYLNAKTTPRVIAIGNAAQTLHPVAGQGLNLGLRDAWELAASILNQHSVLDQPEFAANFLRQRRADRRAEIGLTDSLVRVFSHSNPLLGAARGAALLAFDTLPEARRLLARAMMYGLRSGG